jgi:hypothetical protein
MTVAIRRMLVTFVVLLTASAAPWGVRAQAPDTATLAGGLKSLYRSIRANLVEAADLMPEAN